MNERLDGIKSRLEEITIGHVTTMHDLVVWRVSENCYEVGETISLYKSPSLDLDTAAARIGIAAELPIN